MVKRGISLFLILIIAVAFLHGQEIITADQYLASVSDVYASIKDYEANIEIRQGSTTMAGTVSHLTPSFMRIDFTRPAEQVIVFNGQALVIYLPEYRAVLNQPLNKTVNPASAAGLSMLRRNYVPSFVTGPNPEPLESGSSERVVKLRLTRRNVSEGFREIILNINPNTKLIRRIEARTIAETELRFDFTNIRTNQGIPVARFAYDTPGTASMYNNFLFRDSD